MFNPVSHNTFVSTGFGAPPPANTSETGQLYFDAQSSGLYVHNSREWVLVGAGANTVPVHTTLPTAPTPPAGALAIHGTRATLCVHNGTSWHRATPTMSYTGSGKPVTDPDDPQSRMWPTGTHIVPIPETPKPLDGSVYFHIPEKRMYVFRDTWHACV